MSQASAARSKFRAYGVEQGLTDFDVSCLHQDRAGFLMVCTQDGVFTYDGRRFSNLGPAQGLRDGGSVFDLATGADGRVVVSYADGLFVSDRPRDETVPPSSLHFRPVLHPGVSFFSQTTNRLARWRSGFVFVADGSTLLVSVPEHGPPRLVDMGYRPAETHALAGALRVFSVKDHLWEAFDDGRLCLADPGAVKCYGTADGLRGVPWFDVAAGADGRVSARSLLSVSTLDPASGRWSDTSLPDQGGIYLAYQPQLGLFTSPDGELVTQAAHGLDVLGPSGWRTLTVAEGAPYGVITAAVTDATGQFWLGANGRELVRWVGYGRWESLQKADGLSADIAWQTVRSKDGSLWVATDTGINRVVRRNGSLQVAGVLPDPAFPLAVGPNGDVWSSDGSEGARVIDPVTGSVTKSGMPAVIVIARDPRDAMWFGTEAGLFRIAGSNGSPRRAEQIPTPRLPVFDIKFDGSGGLFYISGSHLRHRHRDGTDVEVSGAWPGGGFHPIALAMDRTGSLWLGGSGGLFRVVLAGDRVVEFRSVPVADIRSNTVFALMIDDRGWIWVGSSLGVSVFDGRRWVSVDADGGLVNDDIDQGGIREDADGSVWIATTEGVSHLLDPGWLFQVRPLRVMVSEAMLGSSPVTARRVAYTHDALSVELGTPSFAVEQSVQFKYRLSGVDSDWVTSSSGVVRYPFVPPGRHTLTVVGVDELTHRTSAPVTLTLDIAHPWWEQWWFELAALVAILLAATGLVHVAVRIRFRVIYARQAELKRLVDEQTAQLRFLAAHDKLTGLLTRTEIEERLAERLATGPDDEELVVALIDADHFKKINDTYGHLAGDDVLRTLGRLVSRSLREGEYAGRYGGEEILLVLNDGDGRGADRILDLHHVIRGSPFPSKHHVLRITCSIGVAWAVRGDSWESLLGRADSALYDAKDGGRDQIVECPRAGQGVDAD